MGETITLGVQAGDAEVDASLEPFYMPLRRLLAQRCIGPYSASIDEFALVLRIDGAIWHWGFEGCKNLRLHKKRRYITVDIGVPRSRWDGLPSIEIKRYLANCVKLGLKIMVRKLQSARIDIKGKDLLDCCDDVMEQYCET